jgi:hypothetical protein
MFQIVCPDLEIGAATQSAEDIVVQMAKEGFAKAYTDEHGEQQIVSPYVFFINEFKDFIAYSPVRMLNFLGNIYDQNPFKASTIKRGTENIINPCITILACENPDQLSKFMKSDIFTGGLSRRFILVNEPHYSEPRPFIEIAKDSPTRQAWDRVKQRLIDIRKITGVFKWEPTGRKFYEPWYIAKQRSLATMTNSLMAGYTSTEHVQLFKVCMWLDVISDKPMFMFTGDLLEHGLSFLDAIKRNMPKLSMNAGRNEMAASYVKAIEMLESAGGIMPKKWLMRQLETELSPFETANALRHLEETDRLVVKLMKWPNGQGVDIERWMALTVERWNKGVKEGQFKL